MCSLRRLALPWALVYLGHLGHAAAASPPESFAFDLLKSSDVAPGCSAAVFGGEGNESEGREGCCHALDHALRAAFERQYDLVSHRDEVRLWSDRQHCMRLRHKLFDACGWDVATMTTCVREPLSYWGKPPELAPQELEEKRAECKSRRFLLWTRARRDYYAGHSHKQWSMDCGIAEAIRLNRTLLLDDFLGIDATHVTDNRRGSRFGAEMPFFAWRNEWHVRHIPALTWSEFTQDCGQEGLLALEQDMVVMPANTPFTEMRMRAAVPLLVRDFPECFGEEDGSSSGGSAADPSEHSQALACDIHGFDICDRPGGVRRLRQPWLYSENAEWLKERAAKLGERMAEAAAAGKDVVCVHIRRGDKAKAVRKWPNLGQDTTPEGLLATLPRFVAPGSILYLATNQPEPDVFFAPLQKLYKVYSYVNATTEAYNDDANAADSPWALLPSTIGLLDYAILRQCEKIVPTFADEDPMGFPAGVSLTTDTKQGRRGG